MFNNLLNSAVAIITQAILFVMLSFTNAYTPTTLVFFSRYFATAVAALIISLWSCISNVKFENLY